MTSASLRMEHGLQTAAASGAEAPGAVRLGSGRGIASCDRRPDRIAVVIGLWNGSRMHGEKTGAGPQLWLISARQEVSSSKWAGP
jgi:hypothetical protein